MPIVESLLTAIVRVNGDALVLHAGERPYVVTPTGQTELASRPLTLEAMTGILNELLPASVRSALEEDGAVQHHLGPIAASKGDGFTVVAARGGGDIWIEVRRRRKSAEVPAPEPAAEPRPEPEPEPEPAPIDASVPPEYEPAPEPPPAPAMEAEPPPAPSAFGESGERPLSAAFVHATQTIVQRAELSGFSRIDEEYEEISLDMPEIVEQHTEPLHAATQPRPDLSRRPTAADEEPATGREMPLRVAPPAQAAGIVRLLKAAAAMGASTLYLTSQARPSVRVDGEIAPLEGEAVLSAAEVEPLMLEIVPQGGERGDMGGTEWICDVPEVGRVRGVTFRDHRGPGAIFRMIPARAISAEQLGLSRDIQGLSTEPDGIVLITGPRGSGKSTLLTAFVDLINRTRSDHVITLESQIKFVHENRLSLVSQRELRGDADELLKAAQTALRENPDVLVLEELRSPGIVELAIEAAQSGRLVIGAVTAHTTVEALERIIDQTPPDRRPKVQMGLAESLRGVVAQVLVRKTGGGRVAAREVLLNNGAVASAIVEGRTSQLPAAIESGRRRGMVPLNDALATFVQSRVVDAREAYRHAADRQGLLARLEQQGADTSFLERLA